ncbi:hypothetical protein ACFO4O_14340 [Glaciecola siphonariae]|uniref:PEP-CTERM protein-sorting domain-containing protein n=1 Tax=Glaciecola siphonariae TaxID=521012 RepID=A0ABV9LXQ1_9ALTE
MLKLKALLASLVLLPMIANAAVINVSTEYDLALGLSYTVPLDSGPVTLDAGDSVEFNVSFANNDRLKIEDGNESLVGWFLGVDNESSFTIENVIFEFLAPTLINGASSIFNIGTANGGAAHIGPLLREFLTAGQSLEFSGFKVSYDVVSITRTPYTYSNMWFIATGDNVSVISATQVPAPSMLMLFLLALLGVRVIKKSSKA